MSATRKPTNPAALNVPIGDAAQMEQIRQSLARVATEVATDAAKKAAKETVKELFTALGVDTTEAAGIIEFQKTIAFATEMRVARETIRKASLKAAVGLVVTGLITLVLLGFKDWLPHH